MSIQYIKQARMRKHHAEQLELFKAQHVDEKLKAQVLLRVAVQLMGAIEFEKSFGICRNITPRLNKELENAKDALTVLGVSI